MVTTTQVPCEDGGMQQVPQIGHFARVCRSKTDNTRKQRVYYLEATQSEEEERQLEEIQQIPQITRITTGQKRQLLQ